MNILTGEINHGLGKCAGVGMKHRYVPKPVGRSPFHFSPACLWLHKHPSVHSDTYTLHVK